LVAIYVDNNFGDNVCEETTGLGGGGPSEWRTHSECPRQISTGVPPVAASVVTVAAPFTAATASRTAAPGDWGDPMVLPSTIVTQLPPLQSTNGYRERYRYQTYTRVNVGSTLATAPLQPWVESQRATECAHTTASHIAISHSPPPRALPQGASNGRQRGGHVFFSLKRHAFFFRVR